MKDDLQSAPRKPRLALMGEFSAGKSTLANLLLGRDISPVQATATQLPPIWYSYGEADTYRVLPDGSRETIDLENLRGATPDNTSMISISATTSLLEACDLIDMPGTSDPNMAADYWESFLPQIDFVIWCTPATQAWRQSEAAIWELMPPHLWENSLLLITRMDKVLSDRDKARVLQRVSRSVEGMFYDVLPIALLPALQGRDNPEVLNQTGASDLVERMVEVFERFEGEATPDLRAVEDMPQPAPPAAQPKEVSNLGSGKIVPRRIVRDPSEKNHARPEARSAI
ncbi:dynamin family protein [Primorskyibacter sp. 2E233]|uniref:dynamin family protein n=1 Tax=Primorskyibacter sp. 2E233 TaxID=3413431 RepID=UPI003BF027E6